MGECADGECADAVAMAGKRPPKQDMQRKRKESEKGDLSIPKKILRAACLGCAIRKAKCSENRPCGCCLRTGKTCEAIGTVTELSLSKICGKLRSAKQDVNESECECKETYLVCAILSDAFQQCRAFIAMKKIEIGADQYAARRKPKFFQERSVNFPNMFHPLFSMILHAFPLLCSMLSYIPLIFL